MTPEEFEIRMLQIWDFSDPTNDREYAHVEADALMCNLLRSLGYGDGIEVFEGQDKWYA